MTGSVRYSIIIATCNREDYLIECLQSAAKAAPDEAEIIVVNDGNPIEENVLPAIQIPVLFLENKGEKGASNARNLGVYHAKGDWLLFLDDDDLVLDGYWKYIAEKIIENLSPHDPAYGFCKTIKFSDRTRQKTVRFSAPPILEAEQAISTKLLTGLGKGFWIARAVFEKAGRLDPEIRVNEDTDLCLTLLAQGASVYSCSQAGVMIYSGSHEGVENSTTKSANAAIRAMCFSRIIKKHSEFLAEQRSLSFWLHLRANRYAARLTPVVRPEFSPAGASLTLIDKILLRTKFQVESILHHGFCRLLFGIRS